MSQQFKILPVPQISSEINNLLKSENSRPEVVCFDFFDTLVGRRVSPQQTKKLASFQLADVLSIGLDGHAIFNVRTVVERRLCDAGREEGKDPEFSLPELAKKLYRIVLDIADHQLDVSIETFVHCFVSIELAVEKSVQFLKKDVVEILKYCHKENLKTVIISDFYLPKVHFMELLNYHQIAEFVDELFVSADYLITKGNSGGLYGLVSQTLRCSHEKMVMIGDNHHADGTMAAAVGINAFCLKEETKATFLNRTISHTSLEDTYNTSFAKFLAPVFPEMGLSLHLFTHRLFDQAIHDGCKTLLFCSKEGEFLRKLFVRYQIIRFGCEIIQSRYFYISRKSTFICSLQPLERESFSRLFEHYRDISIGDFLMSLNFSEAIAEQIYGSLGADCSQRFNNLQDQKVFQKLINSKIFKEFYESHRRLQRDNFLSYLGELDVDYAAEGLWLVDVGWKGSSQNNISQLLSDDVQITGYYLGLLNPTGLSSYNHKKGILFQAVPDHSPFVHVFNNNRSLFEMLLGASHGSADGYFNMEQFRMAKRDSESQFLKVKGGGDHHLVTLLDLPEERSMFEKHIAPLQNVYFALHEELTDLFAFSKNKMPRFEWFAKQHARMVFTPTEEEVELFSKMYHLENFGIFEFTNFTSKESIGVLDKLNNFMKLKRDPAAILETGVWPPIILRQLGLSFMTPIDGKRRFKRIFGNAS